MATTPRAPTWEDVRRAWEEFRPPYVLACPPGRRGDVLDAVTAAGLAGMVEVRPSEIIDGEDAVLFRRDLKPI